MREAAMFCATHSDRPATVRLTGPDPVNPDEELTADFCDECAQFVRSVATITDEQPINR